MGDDKLKPLARVMENVTLATTEGQDRYFLIFASGVRQKLTLQEAAQHYLHASEEREGCGLLWKNKTDGVPKRRTKERRFADESSRWAEEAKRLMENLPPIDGK